MGFLGWNRRNNQHIIFQKPAMDELKKEYSFVDMHVHTRFSHDSKTPISMLMKKAEFTGIGMAITDHKRVEGAIEASKQNRVLVIPGIEIASREGKEVILYFYSVKDLIDYFEKYLKYSNNPVRKPNNIITKSIKYVKSDRTMADLVEKANSYACLKSIPHPYTYLNKSSYMFFSRKKLRDTLRRIEAVEVFTSTNRHFMNKRARNWAVRKGKAFTAGSDAHTLNEFGSAFVACKANTVEGVLDAIKKKKIIIIGEEIKISSGLKTAVEMNRSKRSKDWDDILAQSH